MNHVKSRKLTYGIVRGGGSDMTEDQVFVTKGIICLPGVIKALVVSYSSDLASDPQLQYK